jgi:hypothetical protein
LTDFNTNVSEEAALRYVDDGLTKASKIRCIYNGIDTESIFFNCSKTKAKTDVFHWLAVGRLDSQKTIPICLHCIN